MIPATTPHPPRARALAPPPAAAVAGVIFSLLMGCTLIIVRLAVPLHQSDPGGWLSDTWRRNAVRVAIHLAPFAGIAFLWFIGVFRARLGALEDRFFATIFLGSGLLFVASLFATAAFSAALVELGVRQTHAITSDAAYLIRLVAGSFLNVFAIKMAGMFMFSASTIVLRTAILPRWLAYSGYACALVLLLVITSWPWIALLFPLWMLLLSGRILLAEFRPFPHIAKSNEEPMKILLISTISIMLSASAVAQPTSTPVVHGAGLGKSAAGSHEELNIRAYIELLRTDVRKTKTQVMSDVMQLDTDQATKFWPIYKEFETELSALGERAVAVVRKYADTYDRMTDTIADELGTQILGIEQQRNELKKKYYAKMKNGLGAIMATRFLQVENQLERLIDLQIAAQLPVIAASR